MKIFVVFLMILGVTKSIAQEAIKPIKTSEGVAGLGTKSYGQMLYDKIGLKEDDVVKK